MNKEYLKALEGHPNREAIIETLDSPVEPWEAYDWREGYLVGAYYALTDDVAQSKLGGIETVHRLSHWKGGFDAEAFKTRDSKKKEVRGLWGLEFMEKPNRNGRYEKAGPSNKKKVTEAYINQHRREWT